MRDPVPAEDLLLAVAPQMPSQSARPGLRGGGHGRMAAYWTSTQHSRHRRVMKAKK